jgi:hypothetical protein
MFANSSCSSEDCFGNNNVDYVPHKFLLSLVAMDS